MDRFLAQFSAKLDSKGRVSIPASFRAVLAKDGHEGLFVYRALDQPALDCGGHGLLKQIDGLLARFDPYSEAYDSFATALLAESEILKLDPEGRVAVTERLKAHAGIADAVVFVGKQSKFQIWEPERFRAHSEEAKTRLRAYRQSLEPGSNSSGAQG
ncbi:MAG TPA: division/cell wall cluster transcriptional repressor MraZ [Beijerinckiaceae bacterium]|nr:division/cell wall cluster transcriptional repressor MraZ [Beijerinckiaceae bacterium]